MEKETIELVQGVSIPLLGIAVLCLITSKSMTGFVISAVATAVLLSIFGAMTLLEDKALNTS